MRPALTAAVLVTLVLSGAVRVRAQQASLPVETLLDRVTERVRAFLIRAQSLVCFETVHIQPLDSGLGAAGFGRTVLSELRLSWDPLAQSDTPTEARSLRQVLKVNGHEPRKNDRDDCTSPEQQTSEPQPLSMFLPDERDDYTFRLGKPGKVDGREAVVLEYRQKGKVETSAHELEGKPDCISYSVEGGMRGRVWIDPVSFDVLRLDRGLIGLVDIELPAQVARRPGAANRWTLQMWDTSYRFKPVTFTDPDETLLLPVSTTSLHVKRGGGISRMRTVTTYTAYRRFLTGARIVQPQP
jgi:hypothetical protein